MLIFFLIAGTLAAPLDKDLKLINLSDLEGREPPDALLVFPDKRLTFRGQETDAAGHIVFRRDELIDSAVAEANEAGLVIRLVPDRTLKARDLLDVANELKAQGAARVVLVAERR